MIAAYAIGFSITTDDLAANPSLRFAEGADDTGVIVSWNTEGPQNKGEHKAHPEKEVPDYARWTLSTPPPAAQYHKNENSVLHLRVLQDKRVFPYYPGNP